MVLFFPLVDNAQLFWLIVGLTVPIFVHSGAVEAWSAGPCAGDYVGAVRQ